MSNSFKQRKSDLLAQCAASQSLKKARQVHQHLALLSQLCDDSLRGLWELAQMPSEACLLMRVGGELFVKFLRMQMTMQTVMYGVYE